MENTTDKLSELEEWIIKQIEYYKKKEEKCIVLEKNDTATIYLIKWQTYERILIEIAEIQSA